ncbi:MAG: tRNA pseudouridine(38-40) synthase TruA [Bacteroidota bacterium]
MRYFICLSYLGTHYHGWQIQPKHISVQEKVNLALSTALQEEISVMGAGRTDTGVHAKNFIAHFDSEQSISEKKQLIYKLNNLLPQDIAVHHIKSVKDEAHARFDAISRTYEYKITQEKNPFTLNEAYFVKNKLDIDLMNQAAAILFEYKDFKCFAKVKTQVHTHLCSIIEAQWKKDENGLLIFTIKANRFLRNMVRAIVGTMVEIGLGKIALADFKKIIESKQRSNAGKSVPAHALFLIEIDYPQDIYLDL